MTERSFCTLGTHFGTSENSKGKYNGKVLIHFAQLLYNLTFNSMSFNHFNKIIGWSHQLTIMITLTTFSDLLRNNKHLTLVDQICAQLVTYKVLHIDRNNIEIHKSRPIIFNDSRIIIITKIRKENEIIFL